MAQKKAHEVDGWLERGERVPVVLLYGPDHGLVTERAAQYARSSGLPLEDPFTVVRMDAAEADETGRLIDEAHTFSMFAERRLIWLRGVGAQKRLGDDLKALCDAPPANTTILVEAGDLKKGVGLRAIVEESRNAMALPCYSDGDRDIDRLIDAELRRSNLTIEPNAREVLRQNLGGDRLATRAELEKLAMFALGAGRIELSHVNDLTGDVSTLSLDDAVDAALTGALDRLDRSYQRYCSGGGQPFLVANAAMRLLQSLRVMRWELDNSRKNAGEIVGSFRPPFHFSRKGTIETALRLWPVAAIDRALERIAAAVLETRRRADLSPALVSRAMTALALEAGRQRSRQ